MTEPGDISDLVYADRYAWPGSRCGSTYRRVAIALAAREADRAERHRPLENFLAGAIGAGASWNAARRR